MIESEEIFEVKVVTVPRIHEIMDNVDFPNRLLPVDLSFAVDYAATQKFYRRTSRGRKIPIHEIQEESRKLEFETDSCHFKDDIFCSLDELLESPEGKGTTVKSEDAFLNMVAAVIHETRKFAFGVSKKHKYLHLCCQIAKVQEVIYEETDLFYRSIYNETDLRDHNVRDAILELERINSQMTLTNGKGMPLESVKMVGKKSRERCVICLEEINGSATRMACKHLFHVTCLAVWLSQRNSCPICRNELPMKP